MNIYGHNKTTRINLKNPLGKLIEVITISLFHDPSISPCYQFLMVDRMAAEERSRDEEAARMKERQEAGRVMAEQRVRNDEAARMKEQQEVEKDDGEKVAGVLVWRWTIQQEDQGHHRSHALSTGGLS
jgi:hypothetical protein